MLKLIKKISFLMLVGLILANISPEARAQEDEFFKFNMSSSFTSNDIKSIAELPSLSIEAKEIFSKENKLSIHIPTTIPVIFSGDLSQVSVGGNANNKVETIQLENLSLDHRTLSLTFSEDLIQNNIIYLSGLKIKLYQQETNPKPIELHYDIDGEKKIIQSSETIRLILDTVRRRTSTPETIRRVEWRRNEDGELEISWPKNPDLDITGYRILLVKNFVYEVLPGGVFLNKSQTSYGIGDLEIGEKYNLMIEAQNESGLTSSYSLDFIYNEDMIAGGEDELVAPVEEVNEIMLPENQKVEINDFVDEVNSSMLNENLSEVNKRVLKNYLNRMQIRLERESQKYVSISEVVRFIVVLTRRVEINMPRENSWDNEEIALLRKKFPHYSRYIRYLNTKGIISFDEVYLDPDINPTKEQVINILDDIHLSL